MTSRVGKKTGGGFDPPAPKTKRATDSGTGSGGKPMPPSGRKRRTPPAPADAVAVARPPFPLRAAADGGDRREKSECFREGFSAAANLLRGRRNVLVLAGAGISVSCGIPDFRSKGTGLYSTLDVQGIGLNDPQELFDLEVFKEDPRPFYRFAKSLYPGRSVRPSVSHRFLSLLDRRGMLLRVYTQNIDGLEEVAGVPPSRVVNAHGSLRWARCTRCRARIDASEILDDVANGTVPRCGRPRRDGDGNGGGGGAAADLRRKNSAGASSVDSAEGREEEEASAATSAKRTRRRTARMRDSGLLPASEGGESSDRDRSSGDDGRPSLDAEEAGAAMICGGVIKPGVTFFGEKLDDRVRRRLEADRDKADCLVVIGTSLSVAPMSKVIQYLRPSIPRILINRNIVKVPRHSLGDDDCGCKEEDFRDGYLFDACLLGFCDDVTRALASKFDSHDVSEDRGEGKVTSSAEQEGTVLCDVEDEYSSLDGNIHGLHNHPKDRVFLFPGAVLDNDDSDSDITYEEVAHCDGCQGKIEGSIMKCVDCFDYDLCMKCYPAASKGHYGGKHEFIAE